MSDQQNPESTSPNEPTPEAEPSPLADPTKMGVFAVARARDGSPAHNVLQLARRFCFSS